MVASHGPTSPSRLLWRPLLAFFVLARQVAALGGLADDIEIHVAVALGVFLFFMACICQLCRFNLFHRLCPWLRHAPPQEVGALPQDQTPSARNGPECQCVGRAEVELDFPAIKCDDELLRNLGGELECAVCLAPLCLGESCRKLQCEHYFHAECVLGWWTHSPRKLLDCPLCRRPQRRPTLSPRADAGPTSSPRSAGAAPRRSSRERSGPLIAPIPVTQQLRTFSRESTTEDFHV